MRSRSFFLAVCLALGANGVLAQPWDQAGNSITLTGDYLGCDATSTQPLRLTTIPNQPIQFSTDNALRMRLTQTLTAQTVNGYANRNLSGHLGIGLFTDPDVNRPFSMLHIDSAGGQNTGYRPWMKVGMTLTRWSDLNYFGMKSENNDDNHAVIAWSDNPTGLDGPDLLKFIFLMDNNPNGPTAALDNGLEAARFLPHTSGSESFLGVGDWFSAGLNPTERVDLLDGRLRIRVLPDPPSEATGAFKVMVVDDTAAPSGERGVVKWVDPSTFGAADCDWVVQSGDPHVSSVYDGSNCLWDRRHGVGVGMDIPRAKLHVHHNNYELLGRVGTWSRIESDDFQNEFQGVLGEGGPLAQDGFAGHAEGVQGLAYNCKTTIGVHGHGRFDSQQPGTGSGFLVGVLGVSEYDQPWQASFSAGVYGRAIAPQGAGQAWAGWFQGDLAVTGNAWSQSWNIWSDESLKTNVADVEGALDRVLQLHPRTYQYNPEAAPVLELSDAPQIGLLAQEVEAIVPEVVSEMTVPAQVNDDGTFSEETLTLKGVNYVALVPLLIGAIKEQQASIAVIQQQLAQTQQQLAFCCSAAPTDSDQRMAPSQSTIDGEGRVAPVQERLLRIAPNPFTDRTTLYCNLERSGRMMLLVNSSDGKSLVVLSEGQREAGEFRFDWQTGHLAPGLYYVTLLLDGEQLVKRAVKVRE